MQLPKGTKTFAAFSLADIVIRFDLPALLMFRYKLGHLRDEYKRFSGASARPLDNAEVANVLSLVRELYDFCKKIGFENGSDKSIAVKTRLEHIPLAFDTSTMSLELWNLGEELVRDVFKHSFVQVPTELRQYVNKDYPFGEDVAEAFPSTTNDLFDAGNCLSVGCNMAAAYHLMRAAEVGLWELGKDRQIPCAQAGKIEFTEWGVIIRELESAVMAIQQWSNSSTKEDAHKFYNAALVEVRAFNDGYRRHSAHARPHMPRMEPDEALALWGHVFRFMNRLVPKIGERYHTELVWRHK